MAARKKSIVRRLPTLSWRDFLTFAEMERFLKALAQSGGKVCELDSLGPSREGRPVYCLTITDPKTGPAEDKPAYLVHGNIHAPELSGTHAALWTARRLVDDHRRGKHDLLARIAFHIVPRLNPDGAEFARVTYGSIRSRTDRTERRPNTLYQEDVNGDGLILTMRWPHPDGRFVADPRDKRLLVARKAGAKGPFYRTLPEGLIHDWDGSDAIGVDGRRFDWNRNWSYDWRPEPQQGGAGDFPFSEVEMQHLARFLHGRPNLFGVLGYHNGPGAMLRPPSTGSDADLDEADVRSMEDLAEIGAKLTGFPAVPVIHYKMDRARPINLRGHFHNFGYHHLGLFVFEFELGNVYNSAGLTTEQIFAKRLPEEDEAQMRKVMRWLDRTKPRHPLFHPWKPCNHPQLGRVEIGGLALPYLANPTLTDLRKTAEGTYRFMLEHAGRHPSVRIEQVEVDAVADGVYRIRARVANRGAFPTHVTNKGRGLTRLKGVEVSLETDADVTVLSHHRHHRLGHLAGATDSRRLEWFVSGPAGATCTICAEGHTGGRATRLAKLA